MKPHYFIFGNQNKELVDASSKIVKKLQQHFSDAEELKLNFDDLIEMSIDGVNQYFEAELAQMSLFASRKIVLAKNFHSLFDSKSKPIVKQILSQLQSLLQPTDKGICMVITAQLMKITALGKKQEEWIKASCEVIPTLVTYDNYDPTGKIIEYARLKSLNVTRPAVSALIELIGSDLEILWKEMEKLSLIFPEPTHQITDQDVYTAIGNSQTLNQFKIQDAVAEKNLPKFLHLIKGMGHSKAGEVLSVFSILGNKFTKLLAISDMLDNGISPPIIKKKIGGNLWLADKLLKEVRQFKTKELANIVIAFSRMDLQIKFSHGMESVLLLQDLCEKIIRGEFKDFQYPIKFCRDITY